MASVPVAAEPTTRFSESDIVTFLVGEKEFPLRVHKDLLLSSGSKFFVACLANNFSESQTNAISLPEDSIQAVRTFIEWLYHARFGPAAFYAQLLVNVCVFAGKVCAESYCNDLIDAFRKYYIKSSQYMSCKTLGNLAEAGLRRSAVYRFGLQTFVHMVVAKPKHDSEYQKLKDRFKDFRGGEVVLKDVLLEILEINHIPYGDPNTWTGCHFHDHKEGSVCSAAKK